MRSPVDPDVDSTVQVSSVNPFDMTCGKFFLNSALVTVGILLRSSSVHISRGVIPHSLNLFL